MRTNKKRFCRALAAFPLTHGASLLLPGAANIAVAAGDIFMAASDATGVWWVLDQQTADGAGLNAPIPATPGATGFIAADLAAMQSGLSIVPLIVGEGAVTASRAITAADKGKILSISAPSAGIVLTLDTAATLGNGFYSFIRRRDTNVNAVHVTASWAETVDGLASFHVCQEDFILRSNSTALLRQERQRRHISGGVLTEAVAGVSSYTLLVNDPEVRQAEFTFENANFNVVTNITGRARKNGANVTVGTYASEWPNTTGTTVTAAPTLLRLAVPLCSTTRRAGPSPAR